MIHFISSKYGKISELKIYKYNLNKNLEHEARQKLYTWLRLNDEINLFELGKNFFKTFSSMENSNQYIFCDCKILKAPFSNVPEISNYLAKDILKSVVGQYDQHNFKNLLIVDNQCCNNFIFLKCVRFNVQLFSSGRFYIHFSPSSKIISGVTINSKYLRKLKEELNPNINDVRVSIRSKDSYASITRDLTNKEEFAELIEFQIKKKSEELYMTFNYRSLSQIDTNAFVKFQSFSTNIIGDEIEIIKEISNSIQSKICTYYSKPLFRYDPKYPSISKNLKVGQNRVVEKQSAAYHNGIYKSVNNTCIRQIFINSAGDVIDSNFYELLKRYNGTSSGNKFLSPIFIKSNDIDEEFELPDKLANNTGNKTINAIFTDQNIPEILFKKLYDNRHIFQIYSGTPQKYRLDNFTVKCLCKAGGILNIINDSFESESTYFIGIDLGHSKDFSVIGLTLYNNKGILLDFGTEICAHDESLDPFPLKSLIYELYSFLVLNRCPKPRKVIIHRDGKNNKHDIKRLVNSIMLIFNVITIDVIEIIKSGYPILGVYNDGYEAPKSGTYFRDREDKYAILVTNTQSRKNDLGKMINPIVLKHVYGKSDFDQLIEQVYWFTKVYTNNLYNSSRLPATTEKANNIVGTGLKRQRSSYLG